MVNGLRKLGGSCNVSSIASTDKRETSKQKPTHPRKRKSRRKPRGKKKKRKKRRIKPISLGHLSSNVEGAIWGVCFALAVHYWPDDLSS